MRKKEYEEKLEKIKQAIEDGRKTKVGKVISEEVRNVFLALMFSLSYILFVTPNNYAPTGISGICTMIQYKTGFSLGYLSLIINIPFCIFTYFLVSKDFAIKSFVFTIVYSFSYLIFEDVFSSVESLKEFVYASETDTILPCIIGGILSGFAYGFTFKINSSTGGVDHISRYINKKRPLLNFFWITFAINFAVAVASFFVYGNGGETGYKPVVLSEIYAFISSFVGDTIIKGGTSAYKFFIITPYPNEISNEIIRVLHHTATRWIGTGAYSGEEKDVLVCVVNKNQLVEFKNLLKKYDDTFVFIETVNETQGFFQKIK